MISLHMTNNSAPRLLIYGPGGIGKTFLAAGAPRPVLVQLEDGHGQLRVPTFGVLRHYDDVVEVLNELNTGDHEFRSIIVDSLDWLEPLIWAKTCQINGWKSIEDEAFQKGYTAAAEVWRHFLQGLEILRQSRGMGIYLTGHAEVRRYDSPTTEPFDRYQPKLHKHASALLREHVDGVLFYNWRISTIEDKKSGAPRSAKGRSRGVGGGVRVVHTEERPAYLAKNRWSMPETVDVPNAVVPFEAWKSIADHIPYYEKVTNGSAP